MLGGGKKNQKIKLLKYFIVGGRRYERIQESASQQHTLEYINVGVKLGQVGWYNWLRLVLFPIGCGFNPPQCVPVGAQ